MQVGKLLYDLLKSESSVTEILKEPYYNTSQVGVTKRALRKLGGMLNALLPLFFWIISEVSLLFKNHPLVSMARRLGCAFPNVIHRDEGLL